MSDTPEDDEAAFHRFLSIIHQVFSDRIFDRKFHFRLCVTLKKLSIGGEKLSALILMDNSTVPDITAKDATTDLLMVNRQKGIWDLESI